MDLDYQEDADVFGRPIEIRCLPNKEISNRRCSMENKELLLEMLFLDAQYLACQRAMDYSLFVCRAR